jgi:hypothetical protein
MQPFIPVTLQHGSNGLRAIGSSVLVQLKCRIKHPITSLREEFAGTHLIALFVRRFRRGRGDELLEARIIPERIEHRIEAEQRRSKRHV